MKFFVVHDEGGEILRSGSCPDAMFGIQAGDGEFVIEGVADASTHRVVNGEILEKPPAPPPEPPTDFPNPVGFPDFFRAYAIGGAHLDHFMRLAAVQLGIGEQQ